MIHNPFEILDIKPTINEAIITHAYEVLKQKGGSEEEMKRIDAAFEESLLYARSEGGIEPFIHRDLNEGA